MVGINEALSLLSQLCVVARHKHLRHGTYRNDISAVLRPLSPKVMAQASWKWSRFALLVLSMHHCYGQILAHSTNKAILANL